MLAENVLQDHLCVYVLHLKHSNRDLNFDMKTKLHTWNDVRIPVFPSIFLLIPNVLCPPAPIGGKSLRGKQKTENSFKSGSSADFIFVAEVAP